jgi:hypothetical protein
MMVNVSRPLSQLTRFYLSEEREGEREREGGEWGVGRLSVRLPELGFHFSSSFFTFISSAPHPHSALPAYPAVISQQFLPIHSSPSPYFHLYIYPFPSRALKSLHNFNTSAPEGLCGLQYVHTAECIDRTKNSSWLFWSTRPPSAWRTTSAAAWTLTTTARTMAIRYVHSHPNIILISLKGLCHQFRVGQKRYHKFE